MPKAYTVTLPDHYSSCYYMFSAIVSTLCPLPASQHWVVLKSTLMTSLNPIPPLSIFSTLQMRRAALRECWDWPSFLIRAGEARNQVPSHYSVLPTLDPLNLRVYPPFLLSTFTSTILSCFKYISQKPNTFQDGRNYFQLVHRTLKRHPAKQNSAFGGAAD